LQEIHELNIETEPVDLPGCRCGRRAKSTRATEDFLRAVEERGYCVAKIIDQE
jgi:hypothetical protein